MTFLQTYLSSRKVKKTLSLRPGQEGFSLIELVVVVAVLAVLSAVAIPNFQSMTQKARAAAASNSVATVAKECAVKFANGEDAGVARAAVSLDGYTGLTVGDHANDPASPVPSSIKCYEGNGVTIVATSSDLKKYPSFSYNVYSGDKTCSVHDDMSGADKKKVGCVGAKW